MTKVQRIIIKPQASQVLTLPTGSRFLNVEAANDGTGNIALHVQVPANVRARQTHILKVVLTGEAVPDSCWYIGSADERHVYERVEPDQPYPVPLKSVPSPFPDEDISDPIRVVGRRISREAGAA